MNSRTRMNRSGFFILSLICFSGLSDVAGEELPHSVNVASEPRIIDRVYRSMEGLVGTQDFNLSGSAKPELLWVTGGQVDMRKVEDSVSGTEKFLCHAYLKFDERKYKTSNHNQRMGTHQPVRLFNFVQGQPSINLPRGYGIPVLSSELFEFEYMIINPTPVDRPFGVKSQGTFEYVHDRDLEQPLKPLFMRTVGMHIPVKKGSAVPHAQCSELGDAEKGSTMESAAEPAKSSLHKILKNEAGFNEVYHWMVPPGKHQYRYPVESKFLADLPFDTTVHYINAHLHPHGESIELRDVTEGKTIFRSVAVNNAARSGIEKLTDFSSTEGVLIDRGHQYEMITEYNNTTDHDIDAMAILFLYLLDKTFDVEPSKTSSIV